MKQELMDTITEKTKELMNSVTCCAEARTAAQAWLDAIGTQRIEEVIQAYMKELEEDIVTIQGLIALTESNQGKQISSEEEVVQVAEHAKEIKQQGALYCDCPTCTTTTYILEGEDGLLKAVGDK